MLKKYLKKIIECEKKRQDLSINLIASENYFNNIYEDINTSILSDKYAEGYPGKRYYAGCKYVDLIEKQAIKYCNKLFNVKYSNVQSHSGSQANQAVYMALCDINDTILGLNLKHGGHLTHGMKLNYSGYFYNSIKYDLNVNDYIDYDDIDKIIKITKPKLMIVGASAYSRIINWPVLKKIAIQNNIFFLADISHIAGLIAGNIYPSPVNFVDVSTFTLHKTLRGPRGAAIITNNKKFSDLLNRAVFPGIQGGPFMNVIALKSLCFRDAFSIKFKNYQKNVIKNAKNLAKFLKINGFDIISDGTDSHLFLIDLRKLNITGDLAEKKLEKANIVTNKNYIPQDKNKNGVCSGIRLGTAAITNRGFGENEMYLISEWITDILINKHNPLKIKKDVIDLCQDFPIN